MRLHYWTRAFREVEFDPASGSARAIRLSNPKPDSAPVNGFAAPERSLFGKRHWFALYRAGNSIVFQTGRNHWLAADPSIEFRHSRGHPFVSRFEVYAQNRCVFSIRYSHIGRLLMALIDPTYDKIDQDSDFFLEFVAENANDADWRSHVLEGWQDAQAA